MEYFPRFCLPVFQGFRGSWFRLFPLENETEGANYSHLYIGKGGL